ncbi:urease accessory protein UreF [Skermania piniformis]|uniref:Urease accessory protein n=1 Tax=Skermania pinensis TaxID=39122 RepID=A0ABX8S410_9ACTN|nr:urease accessory UreF family protein [Skermania piniformis]QXQ12539.1 urease accessory protein [Skermania piniformis]
MPLPAPASVTLAMVLADARLPAGGHAHSAGIEPALQAGLPVSDVPALLRGRVATTTSVDAGTAVVAGHRRRLDPNADLAPVEIAWAARTLSPAMRNAARLQGRGLTRLARRLWPELVLPERVSRPVVLGAIAATAGLLAADLVRLVIYDDLATAAAALLKLEPGDPLDATALVLALCAEADHRVTMLAALTDPADIPAAGAPDAEAWAEAHARSTGRLFRA